MDAPVVQRFGRATFPIPDALMALVFAAATAIDFLPNGVLGWLPTHLLAARHELMFPLLVEGGFLMMQASLTDVATRLKKRPPVWAIALIAGGILIFSEHAMSVLKMAWAQGSAVFIPLLLSLAQRATVLWHMPTRSRIEKIAARALIANRITTGLGLFGLVTLGMLAGVVFGGTFEFGHRPWLFLIAGAIYFAVAAYDDWRVRGARFAEKPRVLFGFDPMGIGYLEPV